MNSTYSSLGLLFIVGLSLLTGGAPSVSAQQSDGGGDQIVDGIGETALIARYILNGNVEDRSRNTQNATLHGKRHLRRR